MMSMKLTERSKKYGYEVWESDEYKLFKSKGANYVFNKKTGVMSSWGNELEDDPERCPAPNIADIEVTGCCTGLHNNGDICPFCFPAGTKIRLANGEERNIEDIQIGDKVLSSETPSLREKSNEVLEVYERKYTDVLITFELEDGRRITTTSNHPFYTRNRGWIEASSLTEDDELVTL